MRIRGKARTASYLERGAQLLDLQPEPLDFSALKHFNEFHLEVGTGRGAFLRQLAALHPETFFVGIERFIPIVARAAALAAGNEVRNVHFYKMNVNQALTVLPTHIFAKIYLNFSDPWPKRKQEKHRLTHPQFLALYQELLAPGGWLELKTDNEAFFKWSLESLQQANWRLFAIDHNVPDLPPPGAETEGRYIQTEYETRFRSLQQPIFAFYAQPPEMTV